MSGGEELKKLYEVSMSTIIRIEEDSVPLPEQEDKAASAASTATRAEVLPQQIPSARQRQQELLVEKAVLSSEFKRGSNVALEELEEAFGSSASSSGYQRQTYIEFELDEEDQRNSAGASSFSGNLFAYLSVIVATTYLRFLI